MVLKMCKKEGPVALTVGAGRELVQITAVYAARSVTVGLHFLFGSLPAVSVITVPFLWYYTVLPVRTSHILSLWFVRKYLLCGHMGWLGS